MPLLTSYSFKHVAVTIDKYLVEGFWEGDDVVTIARRADNAQMIVGADGWGVASLTADDSVTITLRLQPNSPANRVLQRKFERNRAGVLAAFAVAVRDTGTGEGGSAPYSVILTRPSIGLGGTASVREWVIGALPWTETPYEYTAA